MSDKILQLVTINRAIMLILANHPEAGMPSLGGQPLNVTRCALTGGRGSAGTVVGFDDAKVVIRPDAAPGAARIITDPLDVLLAAFTAGMVPAKVTWSEEVGTRIWQGAIAVLRAAHVDVEAPL